MKCFVDHEKHVLYPSCLQSCHIEIVEQSFVRNACLFSNSSFRAFLTPQKCHTLLQYRKYGSMKGSYNVLVLLDTILLKLVHYLKLIVKTIADNVGRGPP